MNQFTETVRNSADIVRVVSDYVSLKGAGSAFKGLCPFHSEKTPSFSVHREKQIFHCFGCGAGGDVFSFVMLAEKVSFPEAVRTVAEKCGVPIPAASGLDDKKFDERQHLFEIYERAASYFHQKLSADEAAPARQVLEKRQIQPQYLERFRLGYAPAAGLSNYLRLSDPVGSGLFVKNDGGEVYDRFRRRLMFPIWNERGKTIGFGGRALVDAQPKYLNSPESPLYSKSHVLYALHFARDVAQKAGRLVVVEGYFDCLSLHQAGIENVVASCGTSLTQQQVAIMSRYVPEVVMNYDPDAAGQNAMRRSIDLLLGKGLRIRILKLSGGLDPDDFVRKEGAEVYKRLLANAPYFWQYLMAEAARHYDLNEPAMKATAVQDVVQHVAKIQDRIEQLEVARAVAEGFKVPESAILERLRLTPRPPDIRPAVPSKGMIEPERKLTLAEKQLIHALIQEPEIAKHLQASLQGDFLSEVWSAPVLRNITNNPGGNVENALEDISDEELRKQVRAALLEPFGRVSADEALASVKRLNDAYHVKKIGEIRERLKQYNGSDGAPPELVETMERHMKIIAEKSRVGGV
ncbi:MAG: DNA primase [Acidobacteria bacterium]|nr:MAG: DNA primase [Acidobacteriota bacterium]PYS12962.1 MAG: DNA primase [Acidobacteriota bacterium]